VNYRCIGLLMAAAIALGGAAAARGKSILLSIDLPDRPTAGARLFAQKSCVRCHSLGEREPRVGPDLGRIMFSGSVLDLAGAFWNHAPVMHEKMEEMKIRPPAMTSAEMADIIAFLTAYRYYLTEVGDAGSASAGRIVFTAKGCSRCHDDSGNARWDQPGPHLQRYRGRYSAIFMAQAMWNHGPEMAAEMRGRGIAWPKFTGRDMGDLVAYLQAGTGGESGDRVYFEPGSPRRGRDVFKGKGCLTCHAIAGAGGRGGPDLGTRPRDLVGSVSSIAALMWNHNQGMLAEFRRRGIARVTFSGQEMADVIAYLYFVNYANVRGDADRGRTLFAQKCLACHTGSGGSGDAPDLAVMPALDEPIAIIAAMWNHAPKMERELQKRGMAWPRLEQGDAADLTAFLLVSRGRLRAATE
jgi:cytochrome c2